MGFGQLQVTQYITGRIKENVCLNAEALGSIKYSTEDLNIVSF